MITGPFRTESSYLGEMQLVDPNETSAQILFRFHPARSGRYEPSLPGSGRPALLFFIQVSIPDRRRLAALAENVDDPAVQTIIGEVRQLIRLSMDHATYVSYESFEVVPLPQADR